MIGEKTTILIVDNNSQFVLPLLRSFSGEPTFNLDVLVCSRERIEPFRSSRFLRRIYRVDELNEKNFLPEITRVVKESGAKVIIPTREWISALMNCFLPELNHFVKVHPLPDTGTLQTTGDKWNMNQWLSRNGFPHALATPLEITWPGEYPLLLKPKIGIAGEGIRLIRNRQEMESVLAVPPGRNSDFFFQEYIHGLDIDISFFAIKGRILLHTIQRGIDKKGLTFPRGIEFVEDPRLLEQAEALVRRLNYTGIAHLDFRYEARRDEYILVDFNARYWSSLLGSRAMGVNFPSLIIALTLGNQVEDPGYRKGYYYFSTAALKTLFRSLFSRNRYPVSLRDSQLRYIIHDPLPELDFLLRKLNRFRGNAIH